MNLGRHGMRELRDCTFLFKNNKDSPEMIQIRTVSLERHLAGRLGRCVVAYLSALLTILLLPRASAQAPSAGPLVQAPGRLEGMPRTAPRAPLVPGFMNQIPLIETAGLNVPAL